MAKREVVRIVIQDYYDYPVRVVFWRNGRGPFIEPYYYTPTRTSLARFLRVWERLVVGRRETVLEDLEISPQRGETIYNEGE